MGYLRSRVAYLQGLMEGFEIEGQSREGRVLSEVLDVLGDMVNAIEEVDERVESLSDYVDEMDEDLTDLAADHYGAEDEAYMAEDEDDPEAMAVLCCPDCGQPIGAEAGETGTGSVDVVCPSCGALCSADVDHQAEHEQHAPSS